MDFKEKVLSESCEIKISETVNEIFRVLAILFATNHVNKISLYLKERAKEYLRKERQIV